MHFDGYFHYPILDSQYNINNCTWCTLDIAWLYFSWSNFRLWAYANIFGSGIFGNQHLMVIYSAILRSIQHVILASPLVSMDIAWFFSSVNPSPAHGRNSTTKNLARLIIPCKALYIIHIQFLHFTYHTYYVIVLM